MPSAVASSPVLNDRFTVSVGDGGNRADILVGTYTASDHAQDCFAIKRFRRGVHKPSEKELIKLKEQASVWRRLSHANVARFYELGEYENVPALFVEFFPRGNIMGYISRAPGLGLDRKLLLVQEIARGLRYLHEFRPPVIHGDIRGANIFIDVNNHAVLADYGVEDIVERKGLEIERWMAPELITSEESQLSKPTDIYALAMTIFEIFSGNVPFSGLSLYVVPLRVIANQRPDLPQDIQDMSPLFGDLIQQCWDHNPAKRLSANGVCSVLDQCQMLVRPP